MHGQFDKIARDFFYQAEKVSILICLLNTTQKTIFSFSKCSEKIIFPKKLHRSMIFHVLPGKMVFFPEHIILFFRRKMKDISQKIHGNMIFSVYLVKMVFLFPVNTTLPFCHKSKDDLLSKKYT